MKVVQLQNYLTEFNGISFLFNSDLSITMSFSASTPILTLFMLSILTIVNLMSSLSGILIIIVSSCFLLNTNI